MRATTEKSLLVSSIDPRPCCALATIGSWGRSGASRVLLGLVAVLILAFPSETPSASSESSSSTVPAGFVSASLGAPEPSESQEVSGAYRALSFWGDSRAYPGVDVPDGAFSRAYEYAVSSHRIESVEMATSAAGRGRPTGLVSLQRTGLSGSQDERLAGSAAWNPIGPKNGGGRTLTLAFDPSDPDTIYAGAASGGLWRTTTAGIGASAWQRVDTGFPILGVSTIAFDPGNSNVIYLGTGEVYNHQSAGDLEADRRTRGSYGVGVLKSVDGGDTWSKSLDWSYNQRHGVWAVRVDPADGDVVWAATTDGVYKSIDAGATWVQTLSVVMAMDLVIHPGSPDTVLVGCGNLSSPGRGIYRTIDGGSSWAQVSGGGVPADYMGKVQFGVTPADGDVVYASIGNGFSVGTPDNFTWLLRSDDFGASFTLQNTTDYSRWQGWYAHDVAVHPQNPNIVICVGIDIWKSTNGGVTLNQESFFQNFFTGDIAPGGAEGTANYSHADHHDVVFHPTNPNRFYVANDGGVFRSTDLGDTYSGTNGGYQSQQFYNGSYSSATDPDLAMGGLQDNGSVIYRGNGNWSRWVFGGDGGWCAIHPNDPSVVYATAQFLFVARSMNGGSSFSNISPPNPGGGPVAFIAPFLLAPSNPSILYGGNSFLLKSLDGGDSWLFGQGGSAIDGNPILVIAVSPQNDDVVYLATAPFSGRGRVHRSLNGGATFLDVTGSLPDRYPGDLVVDPSEEGTVYLTFSGFGTSHVYKSTDYGANWSDLDQGVLPDVPATAAVIDPLRPNDLYVGNDIGVFYTDDAGTTWVRLASGLSEAVLVNELSISASDRMLRAFTHGRGVFEHVLLGSPDGPEILSVEPTSGEVRGGNVITLTGSNFGEAQVRIDGIPAVILSESGTTITAEVPEGNREGNVDVTVQQSTGSDSLIGGYTYLPNQVRVTWSGTPRVGRQVTISLFGPAGRRAGLAVGTPGETVRSCCTFCLERPIDLALRPSELTIGANGRSDVSYTVTGELFDIKRIQGVVLTQSGAEVTNCASLSILP